MFGNYFKAAYRNFLRQKLFSAINIIGLALGLAAVMLIMLYVKDEFSYDRWLKGGENLYKLETTIPTPGQADVKMGQVPPALIPHLPEYFTEEIEGVTRAKNFDVIVRRKDKQFNEQVHFVDGNFLEIIELQLLAGHRSGLSDSLLNVAISESMALKYFGEVDAIGEVLTLEYLNQTSDYAVATVFKDIPHNSHMNFQIMAPLDLKKFTFMDGNYSSNNLQAAYAKFRPGADIASVEARFPELYMSVAPARNDPEGYDYRRDRKFNFINVRDVHLYSDKIQQIKPVGDINTVISFIVVALLILLIATINFMNLATVKATKRAKEVVVRKVVGASQKNLVIQYLGEALLTAVLAMLVSATIVEMVLPYYNSFLNKELVFVDFDDPLQVLTFTLFPIIVAVLGGAYPAFFLARFNPAKILGTSSSETRGSSFLLQAMVVFQFAISIGLIIATAIVYSQTEYARTLDLGFETENKLILRNVNRSAVQGQEKILKQELLKLPGVTAAGLISDDLPLIFYNDMSLDVPSNGTQDVNTDYVFVDEHAMDVFGMKPIAGRLYSEEYTSDSFITPEDDSLPITRSAIVNEAFVKQAGFLSAAEAVGNTLVSENYRGSRALHTTIVGVVGNIQLRSLHDPVEPMVFFASHVVLNNLVLNVRVENMPQTLAEIDAIWRRVVPDQPIQRYFVGDTYDALYADERKQGQTFAAFSLFAIFVACLGLFGLAAFSAEGRKKEIGIRKVHGATIAIVMRLLCWQYLKPVLLANLIAWPIVYILMQNWLERFSYRIDIGIHLFVGAGCVALLIAWITVGAQAFRVARLSPIHALRHE